MGNYPSASDLISIPIHQCTCKKVIVRLWPSLFVVSPSRRWKRELFLKQKAFQLIAMCECKHEKQHNLSPSFLRSMKNSSHHHRQIVSVHSHTHLLHLRWHSHRNYRNLCYHGLAGHLFLLLSGTVAHFKPSTTSSSSPPSSPLRFG